MSALSQQNNKRIAKNTLLLYFRMLFSMGIGLFTSRIVLESLGIEDYGIYNLVGGIVTIFAFLNSAMIATSQRFISYELGKGNLHKLKDVFCTTLTIHIAIAFIIVVLSEVIGVWFLNTKLNIPSDRMMAANWTLQLSIFVFAVNVISVPYNASIVAHEKMSAFAYNIFIDMCKDVIENGTSTEGEKVRPVWEDGTPAYTIKRFGVVNRYDLRKEFPALTLRKTALKSAMDEILWIWQQKSNNIHDLHSHIWDSWADEKGSIGKAYGYQLGVKHQYKEGMMDQVDRVLFDLKNNPYSRRIMTNIYVHQDLHEMNLYPCAYSMTFNVTKEPGKDKLVLNAVLNQRSQDILAANNWNVCQYSLLLMMIAQACDMEAGELVHVIADCHIYDRHIPVIKELISRKPYPAPTVKLNPEIKDFYKFTTDDLIVENYETWPQIKNIPIAV